MAIWLMTQMKRWGFIKGDVDYRGIAQRVMLATDARRRLAELGLPPPDPDRKEIVLGKPFDPAKPEAYLDSFAIRRG